MKNAQWLSLKNGQLTSGINSLRPNNRSNKW